MSDRERALWQAISRGLKLISAAIDRYIGNEQPTAAKRYTGGTGSEARPRGRP